MSCDCENITCIKIYVSACDTGVNTGLAVPSNGNYTVRLKFNNAYKILVLALVANAIIVLPNIVNGNYVHELQILNPDGTLLNDTCYSLIVKTVINKGNGLTPSPLADPYSAIITLTDEMVSVDGTQITNSLFGGKVINEIDTDNQSYLIGVAFSQNGNTISGITISFFMGQVIKVSW